jgi:hypothetical protein
LHESQLNQNNSKARSIASSKTTKPKNQTKKDTLRRGIYLYLEKKKRILSSVVDDGGRKKCANHFPDPQERNVRPNEPTQTRNHEMVERKKKRLSSLPENMMQIFLLLIQRERLPLQMRGRAANCFSAFSQNEKRWKLVSLY